MADPQLEDYISLAQKLAWSFHKTTGLEFEEILSTAYLAFTYAKMSFDPTKGSFSTYLYYTIMSNVIDHCKQKHDPTHDGKPRDNANNKSNLWEAGFLLSELIDYRDPEKMYLFKEALNNMSNEAKSICSMVLDSPTDFIDNRPKLARGKVYRKLREVGWSWPKIWKGFKEIKLTLNEK